MRGVASMPSAFRLAHIEFVGVTLGGQVLGDGGDGGVELLRIGGVEPCPQLSHDWLFGGGGAHVAFGAGLVGCCFHGVGGDDCDQPTREPHQPCPADTAVLRRESLIEIVRLFWRRSGRNGQPTE